MPIPQVVNHPVIMESGIELMLFLYSPQSRRGRTCVPNLIGGEFSQRSFKWIYFPVYLDWFTFHFQLNKSNFSDKSLQPKRTINKKFHKKIREIRKSNKSVVQTIMEF